MSSFLVNYTSDDVTGVSYAVTGNLTETTKDYQFKYPLRLGGPNRQYKFKVSYASISSYTPNIINSTPLNTSIIELTRDGGTTWTTVQLTTGKYSISQINSAINSAVASWYKDTAQPAFHLLVNTAVTRCYIVLDSTKLIVPAGSQIGVRFSASKIWDVLGFRSTDSYVADGSYTATNLPKINYFGDVCDIYIQGLSNANSYYNGTQSNYVCRIPFVENNTNEHVYVNYSNNYINAQLPPDFYGFKISAKTTSGQDLMIYDGHFSIIIDFLEN